MKSVQSTNSICRYICLKVIHSACNEQCFQSELFFHCQLISCTLYTRPVLRPLDLQTSHQKSIHEGIQYLLVINPLKTSTSREIGRIRNCRTAAKTKPSTEILITVEVVGGFILALIFNIEISVTSNRMYMYTAVITLHEHVKSRSKIWIPNHCNTFHQNWRK